MLDVIRSKLLMYRSTESLGYVNPHVIFSQSGLNCPIFSSTLSLIES